MKRDTVKGPFTEREIEALRAGRTAEPPVPFPELARQLGRTAETLRAKAYKLGLIELGNPGPAVQPGAAFARYRERKAQLMAGGMSERQATFEARRDCPFDAPRGASSLELF
ncbi:MAG: hypothetical protein ACQRW7_11495 [Caulobacterales bacterium]|uniref:hypothetical protein n=1 Tax=Glycocaulis sp. TaxID=1969725 RepID=UPI003FA1070F